MMIDNNQNQQVTELDIVIYKTVRWPMENRSQWEGPQ